MRIHKVELEHVRNIKSVSLDLSAPLTIIAGRNGVGKSTLQQAILSAMFKSPKAVRDTLISRFDTHSKPFARITFSRDGGNPTIFLSRTLTDDNGEWREGNRRLKQKGKALEMVQDTLPISDDAAALLLWGRQEEMGEILKEFPSDGYSLLTAATVKGSGPDPHQILDLIEKQIKETKRGGKKNPGSLTRANEKVKSLEEELENALEAQRKLEELQKKYTEKKSERDQFNKQRESLQDEIEHMEELEGLLDAAVQQNGELSKLEKRQEEWDALDDQMKAAQGEVDDLKQDLNVLQAQYRVAKDSELSEQIKHLGTQIELVEESQKKVDQMRKALDAKKRPDSSEVKQLQQLQREIENASNRMEASGVRYELSAELGEHTVEISEDNDATKQMTLSVGETQQGIVGQVVIRADGLHISASGKEDVAGHKRMIEQTQKKVQSLFRRFRVKDEDELIDLADERARLERGLKRAENNVEKELKGETLDGLKAERARLEEARRQNQVTPKDRENCAQKHLRAASEIEKDVFRKQGKLETAQKVLRKLEQNKPTDSDKGQLQKDLRTARKEAGHAASEFKEADEEKREPNPELLTEIRKTLKTKRDKLATVTKDHSDADKLVTGIVADLKYAGPDRALDSIEVDLKEAQVILNRENVFQKARELLRRRIEEKMYELAESVPISLAERIGQHLSQLSNGIYEKVHLSDDLTLSSVSERSEEWKPDQLGCGERTLTALTVKIAVARSLAETSGAVFVILDDSLVNLDPQHRTATEDLLLDLVKDGKLQVILMTCHTDWATDWLDRTEGEINYVELEKITDYYRTPAAIAFS